MRAFHRWVGVPACLFLIFIALTGSLLHLDMIRLGTSPPGAGPPPGVAHSTPPAPPPAAPNGKTDYHFILQDLHAGYFFGWPGRILSLVSGLVLLVLSLTGLKVYWDMFARRRRSGHKELFWR